MSKYVAQAHIDLLTLRYPSGTGDVAFALLACMAASSGLLWFNYRGVDFSGAEDTIYGALFGVSVFGAVMSLLLVLMV